MNGSASRFRIGLHAQATTVSGAVVDRDGAVVAGCRRPLEPGPAGVTGAAEAVLDALVGVVGADRVGRVDRVVVSLPEAGTPGPGPVGILRIGAPAATAVPPLTGWPARLAAVAGPVGLVAGGHEYDGRELAPLDLPAVTAFARQCRGAVTAVAVVGVHGHENPAHEDRAAEVLADLLGEGVPVLRGAESGGRGLLERENTTVLDAAAAPGARCMIDALGVAVSARLPAADLHLMRGDGTVLPALAAYRHTTATRGAMIGSTLMGALHRSGRSTAVVIAAERDGRGAGAVRIGTATAGLLPESGTFVLVDGVHTVVRARRYTETGWDRSGAAVDRVRAAVGRCRPASAPLVVVGELAAELPDVGGGREVLRPAAPELAGAVGAAVAEAAGSVDRIFWIGPASRESCVAEARQMARDAAIRSGADPRLLRETPVQEGLLTYVPLPCVRLRVTAVGPLLDAT